MTGNPESSHPSGTGRRPGPNAPATVRTTWSHNDRRILLICGGLTCGVVATAIWQASSCGPAPQPGAATALNSADSPPFRLPDERPVSPQRSAELADTSAVDNDPTIRPAERPSEAAAASPIPTEPEPHQPPTDSPPEQPAVSATSPPAGPLEPESPPVSPPLKDALKRLCQAPEEPPSPAQIDAEIDALRIPVPWRTTAGYASRFQFDQHLRLLLKTGFDHAAEEQARSRRHFLDARRLTSSDPRLELARGLVELHQGRPSSAMAAFRESAEGGLLPAICGWLTAVAQEPEPNAAQVSLAFRRAISSITRGQESFPSEPACVEFARALGRFRESLAFDDRLAITPEEWSQFDAAIHREWTPELIAGWTAGRTGAAQRRQLLDLLCAASPEELSAALAHQTAAVAGELTAIEAERMAKELNLESVQSEARDQAENLSAEARKHRDLIKPLQARAQTLSKAVTDLSTPRLERGIVGERRVTRKDKNGDRREYFEPVYGLHEPSEVRAERLQRLAGARQEYQQVLAALKQYRTLAAGVDEQRKTHRHDSRETLDDSRDELHSLKQREEKLNRTLELLKRTAESPESLRAWRHDPTHWTGFDPATWGVRIVASLRTAQHTRDTDESATESSLVDFDEFETDGIVGNALGRFPADLFVESHGVSIGTCSLIGPVERNALVRLIDAAPDFEIVGGPDQPPISPPNLIVAAGGGTRDLLLTFDPPVTQVSIVSDRFAETPDVIRLIILEPAEPELTARGNRREADARVVMVAESVDNAVRAPRNTLSVQRNGKPFQYVLIECTTEQEAFDNLRFTRLKSQAPTGGDLPPWPFDWLKLLESGAR